MADRPKVPSAPIKPTLETRFYIDYEWWDKESRDLKVQIKRLCAELDYEIPADEKFEGMVDWVNPETGEVVRVDRLVYLLMEHCATHEDFISERTSLIDAIFRALLASGNRPMTPVQLAEMIGRDSQMILRTLSGVRVYKGIRPIS